MLRPRQVLVFGEDANDVYAVAELVRPLLRGDGTVVRAIRKPPIFASKDTERAKRLQNADRVKDAVDLYAEKANVRFVIVHRDCDAVEPTHISLSAQIKQEFEQRLERRVVPATPAWELEAWLLLFPAACADYRPCWARFDLKGRNVGSLKDAKEHLRRALRSNRPGCRDYREADCPEIARKAAARNGEYGKLSKQSGSLAAFLADLSEAVANT